MEDRDLVISRAKNAVISRDFDLAIRLYNSLLTEEPNNQDFLNALGNIYIKLGKDEKALSYFETILEKSPSDSSVLNSVGGIYRRLKIYDDAIVVLQKALEIDKNSSEINYNLGFTYKSMGRNKDAVDCFESVIATNPSDVLAYNHLASIYAQEKDYAKAIGIFKKGLQVDHNHPILQYNLAKAYLAIKDDTNAVSSFEVALRAKPGWVDAVKDYAEVLLNHRKTRAAIELVNNSIELHQKNPDLYELQGKILLNQCNYDGAIKSFLSADNLKPNNSNILMNLAKAYIYRGKKSEALNSILEAEQYISEENALDVKKVAIDIFLSTGKYQQALDYLKSAAVNNKKDVTLMDLAGQYYVTQKKNNSIKTCLEKIHQFDSSYERYLVNWARRYHEVGNNEKSRELYQKYLDSNNKDVEVWVLLAMLDEELGNNEYAEDEYSTALAFDPANYAAKVLSKKLSEKMKELAESKIGSEDFDLNDFIEKNDEDAECSSSDNESIDSSMEDVDIFDFDDSITPEGKVDDQNDNEENNAGQEDSSEEENNDGLVDSFKNDIMDNLPVESMLDYKNDDKSLIDDLVTEKNDEEIEDDEEAKSADDSEEIENEDEPKKEDGNLESNDGMESSKNNKLTDSPTQSASNQPSDTKPVYNQSNDDKPNDDFWSEKDKVANNENFEMEDDILSNDTEVMPKEYFKGKKNINDESFNPTSEINKSISDAEGYLHQVAKKVAESVVGSAADKAEEKLNNIVDDIQTKTNTLKDKFDEFNKKQINIGSEQIEKDFEELVKPDFADDTNLVSDDSESDKCNNILEHVSKFLPLIENMLVNKEDAAKFRKEVLLFQQLKDMGEMASEDKKHDFLIGKTRLLLDFLIARLSGKPGLLRTSKSLRKSGALDGLIEEDELIEDDGKDIPIEKLASEVLGEMCILAKDLPDKSMSEGLIKLAEDSIKTL